jgi:hypothetical protein
MDITLSLQDWLLRTEELISGAITGLRPNDWKEDIASYRWMQILRDSLPVVEITDLGHPYAMTWDALKLERAQETPYGDIGVFVRIDYPNGTRMEGIGFMEAKRFYPEFDRYNELREKQLATMVENVRHHRLGLYTQTPISEAVDGLRAHGVTWAYDEQTKLVHPGWRSVAAAVVPSTVALTLRGKRPRDLHPASLPLSYQLCARYLAGYDLDTDAKKLDEVRKGGLGSPTFLFISHVVIGGETHPTTENGLGLLTPGGPYSSLEPEPDVAVNTEVVAEPEKEQELETGFVRNRRAQQRTAARPTTPKRQLRLKG